METVIQTIILILGLLGIGGTIAEHGKPSIDHPPGAVGAAISIFIGLAVATIIFWNPTTIPDVIAWMTILAALAWNATISTVAVITHNPNKTPPINTTTKTLSKLTQNLTLITACIIGILN